MENQKLTLQQALEQGYTHFFYKGEGYQAMNELSQVTDEDFKRGLELVNKETETISSYVTAEDIREFIAETSEERHSDETGSDTETCYPLLIDIPIETFNPIMEVINEAMKSISYYKGSGIELVKEI